MQIDMRPIDTIAPYENNPRHNDAGVDAVAKSIEEFGFRQPIVVDENHVIIVGHTRYKAARKLGLEKVPVHVAVGLTDPQIKAYRIADNQTATLSQWDNDLLPLELADLQNRNFNLDLTGFSADELISLLGSDGNEGTCDPDAIPEPPDQPQTKAGDLWVLGNHRLLCGDSCNPDDVDRLLDGQPIHLVNTDPPYNVSVEPRSNNAIAAGLSSFKGGHPSGTKLRVKDRPLANDAVSDEQFKQFLSDCFQNMSRVLLPGRSFYIWGGYVNLGVFPPILKDCGLYFSQAIVWDKAHPVLTRKDFMGCYELAYYGWKQGAGHQFFGPNNALDLWHIKKVSSQQSVHLTEKPNELATRAMEYSSRPGEHVLDPFGGSGSTLIAAEQVGRKAFLMELDPLYVDIIVERYVQFVGSDEHAHLHRDGKVLHYHDVVPCSP